MSGQTSQKTPIIHQQRDSSTSSRPTHSSDALAVSLTPSSASIARTSSSTEAREYGASGHFMTTKQRGSVDVINRRQVGYDKDAPQPTYNSGYAGKKNRN